jgi:arylsulfate sulfotransferase
MTHTHMKPIRMRAFASSTMPFQLRPTVAACCLLLCSLFCFARLGFSAEPPLMVHLHSNLPSPQAVGTPIGLFPAIENAGKGLLVYQYSVSINGGPFRVFRDFSQQPFHSWAPELAEHSATVRVKVRDNETKATAQDELPFRIISRVKDEAPLVTPTAHPLVALFSAPPCSPGTLFRVAFATGDEPAKHTPDQPCGPASNNVYVAGMRADTEYQMREELMTGGDLKGGAWLPFHTGIVDGFNPVSIVVPRTNPSSVSEPVLIYSALSLSDGGVRPTATDLSGRVLWYLRSPDTITRVLPGGRFLVLADGANSVNFTREEQLLREIDVAGNIVRETNAGVVAEQLASHGIHSDCHAGGKECVSGFHHEAIRLPNGHTMVIAGLERMMPAGTQGSKGPVDILGDLIIDLDQDFQVTAVWNEYDHLDLKRKSLEDAKCHTGGGGCPAVLLAPEANGWTHSNALEYIPSSGDFLVSLPEQDWILKVDWKDGKGSGKILWRLGKDGDFKREAGEKGSWFSYQHDVGYEPNGSGRLTLMNNNGDPKTGNRAQIWKLDEEKHIAKLEYDAEMGVHVICCGSMQLLKNGDYSAQSGWVLPLYGRTAEVDKAGKIVFAIDFEGAIVYRSFRVDDMYSAPPR